MVIFCGVTSLTKAQENTIRYYLVDNNQKDIEVKNIEIIRKNEAFTAIKVTDNKGVSIFYPKDVKGFKYCNSSGKVDYCESIFSIKYGKYDFTKEGVFLEKFSNGPMEAYWFRTSEETYLAVREKEHWEILKNRTLKQQSLSLFKGKPTYPNLVNIIKDNNLSKELIIDLIRYNNEPPIANPDEQGYSDLKTMYHDFGEVLRTGDSLAIVKFCNRLMLDDYTNEYCKKYRFKYRIFPANREALDLVRREYIEYIFSIRRKLICLDDLSKVKFVSVEDTVHTYDYRYNIGFAEPIAKMSEDGTVQIGLGEFLVINGRFKSVSYPKY
jgi:hypothetical protein